MTVAIARLSRVHWTTLVVVVFLGGWWIWALDVGTRYVAPGLLDDGSHIARALYYVRDGFLPMFTASWAKVVDPTSADRFYEVQYGILGLFAKLFGTDLRFWYVSQFLFCTLTAIAGYAAVFHLTRSRVAAAVCLTGILTVSPLADAARANFGKVEVVMAMATMFALAGITGVPVLMQRPASLSRNLTVAVTLAVAIIFLAVASVAKESGKLVVLLPLIFAVLAVAAPALARRLERRRPAFVAVAARFVKARQEAVTTGSAYAFVCVLTAALVLAFSFYVFRERGDSSYLAEYFSLDLSPGYLLNGLRFYASQSPDLIILLMAIAPIAVFGFMAGGRSWAMLASLAAIAACYMFLLFAFRYRASYYAYVPAVLTAAAFAIAITLAPRRYQLVLLGVFVLTRLYSVPYIAFQAASQRYVDFVNFRAMQTATDLGASRVILLDASEQNQLIQEWNLLRAPFFDNRLPPIFGGPPDFKAWAYQQRIRDIVGSERAGRLDASGYLTGVLPSAGRTSEPDVGDLVAVRSGRMRFGAIAARAVLPLRMNESTALDSIDTHALVSVARVGGAIPGVTPCACGIGEFDFGWHFFRVVSVPRFLVLGREQDGWMNQRASVRVRVASPGRSLRMTIEVPGWLPRRYPITIRTSLNGETLALLPIANPGRHELSVPLDRQGDIAIEVDRCGDPGDAPVNDRRPFCYWLASAEESGP